MNKKQRVVITGLGVVSPNGIGIPNFTKAIKNGESGIRFQQELKDLNFSCCIGGIPPVTDEIISQYFTSLQLRNFNSSGILYGCIAGMEAWKDAGLEVSENSTLDVDSGTVFGTAASGVDKFRESIYKIDDKKVKRLGSTVVLQTMASGVTAYLGGILGLGNQVTTNSSACTTGTEAIIMGMERIQFGKAKRMLVGSCSDHGAYLWGGFDAMRVITYKHNDDPEKGSRPMSATASGFVPGSGAGALVLESLDSALERGVTIYAEVLGGNINSGGQRNGGTMTAPNSEAVQRCITDAIEDAGINALEIDAINGHLTATIKDPVEVKNWSEALGQKGSDFPYINSLKSMIGHCLAASGAVESVATVLQLKEGFIFPSINSEDVHEDIKEIIDISKIPQKTIYKDLNIIAKASFGFGDVNGCVIFKKY
ncbi:beta-ketoacyl-[acyl-carrier-protein] synthase family protein [Flavobacteriaceae bacterium AU392]|nr:beta-ketoacyl-[acyl-carrier-protein] synthase family protein [Flavobacteriaceae bacterium]RKM84772.1 beta-ketoacyl-[acyl-carrier-protein] synthase family protein [Flavobacteriaceae bacterium AU392]